MVWVVHEEIRGLAHLAENETLSVSEGDHMSNLRPPEVPIWCNNLKKHSR